MLPMSPFLKFPLAQASPLCFPFTWLLPTHTKVLRYPFSCCHHQASPHALILEFSVWSDLLFMCSLKTPSPFLQYSWNGLAATTSCIMREFEPLHFSLDFFLRLLQITLTEVGMNSSKYHLQL